MSLRTRFGTKRWSSFRQAIEKLSWLVGGPGQTRLQFRAELLGMGVGPIAELIVFIAGVAGGVVAIVLGVTRRDLSQRSRLFVGFGGALATLIFGWMIVMWAYIAACTRAGNVCL